MELQDRRLQRAGAGVDRPAIVMVTGVRRYRGRSKEAFILDRYPVVARHWSPFRTPRWRCPPGYDAVMSNYLADHRYTADNMDVGVRRGPADPFSLEDEVYLRPSTRAGSTPPTTPNTPTGPRSQMAAMAPLASGIQLADENLGARPPSSPPTRTWRNWTGSAPNTTRTAASIPGWDESMTAPTSATGPVTATAVGRW